MDESFGQNLESISRAEGLLGDHILQTLKLDDGANSKIQDCFARLDEDCKATLRKIDKTLSVSDRAKAMFYEVSNDFLGLITSIANGVEDLNALDEFCKNLQLVALSQDLTEKTKLPLETCFSIIALSQEHNLDDTQIGGLTKVFRYLELNGKNSLAGDLGDDLSGHQEQSALLRDFYQSVAVAAVVEKVSIKELVNEPFAVMTYDKLSEFTKKHKLKVSGLGICGVNSIVDGDSKDVLLTNKFESKFTPEERAKAVEAMSRDFSRLAVETEKLGKLVQDPAVSEEERVIVEEAYANALASVIGKANGWCAMQGLKTSDCYFVEGKLSRNLGGEKLSVYLEGVKAKAETFCKPEYFDDLVSRNVDNCFSNDELGKFGTKITDSFKELENSIELQTLVNSLGAIRPNSEKGEAMVANMTEDAIVKLSDSLVAGILEAREKLEGAARLIRVAMASGSDNLLIAQNPLLLKARNFKLSEALKKIDALLKWGPSPLSDRSLNAARLQASGIKKAIENRNVANLKNSAIMVGGVLSIVAGGTAVAMVLGKLSSKAGSILFGTGAQEAIFGKAVGVLATNIPRINAIGRGAFTTAGLSVGGVAGANATAYGLNQILGEDVFPVVKNKEEFAKQAALAFVTMGTMSILAKGATSASSALSAMRNPIAHRIGLAGEGFMRVGGRTFSPATWFEKGRASGGSTLRNGNFLHEFSEEVVAIPAGAVADFFQAGGKRNLLGIDLGNLKMTEVEGRLVYRGDSKDFVENLKGTFDLRRGDIEIKVREDGVVEVDFIGNQGSGKFDHYEINPAFEGLDFDQAIAKSGLKMKDGQYQVSSMGEMKAAADVLARNGFVFEQTGSGVVTATHIATGQNIEIVLSTEIMNRVRAFNEQCDVAAQSMFEAIDNFKEGNVNGALDIQAKVAAFIAILTGPDSALGQDGYEMVNDLFGLSIIDNGLGDGRFLGAMFIANVGLAVASGASARVKTMLNYLKSKTPWIFNKLGIGHGTAPGSMQGNRIKKLRDSIDTLTRSSDGGVKTQADLLKAKLNEKLRHIKLRISSWRQLLFVRGLNQQKVNELFDKDEPGNPGLQKLLNEFESAAAQSPINPVNVIAKGTALMTKLDGIHQLTPEEKVSVKGFIRGLIAFLFWTSLASFTANKVHNVFKDGPPSNTTPPGTNQTGEDSSVQKIINKGLPEAPPASAKTTEDGNLLR